jgi:YD repeat-containing protein
VQTLKYQIDYVPGIPSTSILTSGFLERTIYYDRSNVKVKEIVNTPLVAASSTYWAFKVNARNTLAEGSDGNCANYYCFNLNTCFYPVQLGKLVTSKTIEYNYFGTNSSQNIKETAYNNRVLVAREAVTNSDGVVSSNEYKYLSDYTIGSSGWLYDLSKKNVIETPIEVINKVNSNVVAGSFVKYKTQNGKTLPSEIYTVETDVPKSIPSTAPSAVASTDFKFKGKIEYDNFGNVSWTQAADNVVTSYLWGYGYKFPIAVVQNANLNQILHTSFEEETTNTSSIAKTGLYGYSAAYTISLPSAGTYKLTYWKKVGTEPWQLVEEVLSSSKTIGGSGAIIDEIRLHPLVAQMVTYTYDPMVGITSATDQNNNIAYYYYDSSGRLKSIKDANKNLVKAFDYNYQE